MGEGPYKLCTRTIYPIKTFRLVGTMELVISNDLSENVTDAMACNPMIVHDVQCVQGPDVPRDGTHMIKHHVVTAKRLGEASPKGCLIMNTRPPPSNSPKIFEGPAGLVGQTETATQVRSCGP